MLFAVGFTFMTGTRLFIWRLEMHSFLGFRTGETTTRRIKVRDAGDEKQGAGAERDAADGAAAHRALFWRAVELAEDAGRPPARWVAGIRVVPFRRRLARVDNALRR